MKRPEKIKFRETTITDIIMFVLLIMAVGILVIIL